ncbi:DegT/DnrJ/EryC1/StrS family aminotransferase [Helicobacter pametensis]|uniref:DegT/DnrJ/EryC1/StrS family aminotransferase n=1 Tax=Helicobacter pametensis TaxID=95149 RepID=UPI00048189A8|nr:DegT/DnrJ/EryC1/StrS aminotransferase family protein [Helicobacter pametensis]
MKKNIPFYLESLKEEDLACLTETIRDRSVLSEHPEIMFGDRENCVERYEDEVIKLTGAKHAVAVHADYAALLIAFRVLGLKRNHRVICSIYCHPFVPACIRLFDAEPLFVDIDPQTLAMLPRQCEELLSGGERIRAIVVSHLGGNLVDMRPFHALKEQYGIGVIEDLSYCLGLRDERGVHAGIDFQTDFAIVSHFGGLTRRLFGIGMLLSNNTEFAKRCRNLRYHSIVKEATNNGFFYDITELSSDYNANALSAHIALIKVKRTEQILRRREEIERYCFEELKDFENIEFLNQERVSTHALLPIFFKKDRDRIADRLFEYGIEARLPYVPFNLLSFHQNKSFLKVTQFPNAVGVYQRVMCLPCYDGLSDESVQYMVDVMKQILNDGMD